MQGRARFKSLGINIVGIVFFIIWASVLVHATLLGRNEAENIRTLVDLFWCVKSAWMYKDAKDWYMIIGNILLFMPFGWILPTFFVRTRRYGLVTISGFFISLLIEVIQLVWHLGFFELDDLLHNTLGCALGYGVFVIGMWIVGKKCVSKGDKMVALVLWIGVISFFTVAYVMGQPLFDGFEVLKV